MNAPIELPWKHSEWSGIEGVILPALVGVMRLCWIWPWMLLLQAFLSPGARAPLMPPLTIIALPVLSFTLARWTMPTLAQRSGSDLRLHSDGSAQAARASRTRREIAAGGFAAILFFLWLHDLRPDYPLWDLRWLLAAGYDVIYWDSVPLEVPGTLLFLILGILLWLRGALDGHGRFHHDEIWRAFLWGGAALALFAWIAPAGAAEGEAAGVIGAVGGPMASMSGLLLLFAGAGLAGLGVANLRKSGGWRRSAHLGKMRPHRSWMVGIGLTILSMLGIALLIGLIIQPEDAALLWRALGVVWQGVSTVLVWIIAAIAYPIFVVLEYLMRLFRSLFGEREQEREAMESGPPPTPEPFPETPERAVEAVPEPYRWVALLAIAVGVFVLFMLVLRQLRGRPQADVDDLRESVLTANLLQGQLAELWARLRSRFGPAPQQPDPFLSLEGETDTRRLIRLLFQRLLTAAQMRDAARRQGETPHNFGRRLSGQPQFDGAPVQTIASAYTQARYGREPPSQETAESVQRAWQQVETDLAPEETGQDKRGDSSEK